LRHRGGRIKMARQIYFIAWFSASVGCASRRREPLTSEREGPWVVFGFPALAPVPARVMFDLPRWHTHGAAAAKTPATPTARHGPYVTEHNPAPSPSGHPLLSGPSANPLKPSVTGINKQRTLSVRCCVTLTYDPWGRARLEVMPWESWNVRDAAWLRIERASARTPPYPPALPLSNSHPCREWTT